MNKILFGNHRTIPPLFHSCPPHCLIWSIPFSLFGKKQLKI